ncbi:MAG: ATP-dependent sacrificial sulfur transferase LarE [Sedimentisphaerales bacterium]
MGSTPTIGCMAIKDKNNSLQQILRELGKVVVAYSGGADSTFLLSSAVDTLGADNVLACMSVGPSEPSNLFDKAVKFAGSIGAEFQKIDADELNDPNFTANKADRCFHCKSHLCKTLLDVARQRGFDNVIFGTNFDDLDDFRPGNRALKAFGIRSPLAEAKLTKDDIRALSREMKLPTAEQPASPCLASRIVYGLEVTEQRLQQIDEAENFLRGLGLVEFRVRHHDTVARIEVNPKDIEKVTAEPARSQIVEKLKSLGFKFVTVDLQGFRSGALNESLSEQQKRENL